MNPIRYLRGGNFRPGVTGVKASVREAADSAIRWRR